MKTKVAILAFCCLYAAGIAIEVLADDAAPSQSTSKKKQKRKSKKGAAAAGAAAATPPVEAPAQSAPATPAATPSEPAPAAAPAAKEGEGSGNVVKTDLYTVVDGVKVDKFTMDGFRTWRSAACDRCHGPNQEGLVGPSLIERLKVLTKDEFKKTVLEGRLEKGMPSFNTNERVVKYIDNLYAYLKGRSDGAITKAKTMEMD